MAKIAVQAMLGLQRNTSAYLSQTRHKNVLKTLLLAQEVDINSSHSTPIQRKLQNDHVQATRSMHKLSVK